MGGHRFNLLMEQMQLLQVEEEVEHIVLMDAVAEVRTEKKQFSSAGMFSC